MPVYVFRFDDGREVEEVFNWRDVPQELVVDGQRARRVPARFAAQFPNAAVREKAARGFVPYESGMDRDAARAREYREQEMDKARREVIADTLSQFPS